MPSLALTAVAHIYEFSSRTPSVCCNLRNLQAESFVLTHPGAHKNNLRLKTGAAYGGYYHPFFPILLSPRFQMGAGSSAASFADVKRLATCRINQKINVEIVHTMP